MSSIKHRHLSRSSAHRQALLRNMAQTLIEHESIQTSYAKAKEAQRFVEKLITLGKKNTEASKNKARAIFYQPDKHLPKLFGVLRERYATRPGGYTRIHLTEPKHDDAARSAILSLVDGPRDMRFSMTAKAIARERETGAPMHILTAANARKVTRFREDGQEALEEEVKRLEDEKRERESAEKKEFEEKGTRWEWVRAKNDRRENRVMGPGRLEKRRVRRVDEY